MYRIGLIALPFALILTLPLAAQYGQTPAAPSAQQPATTPPPAAQTATPELPEATAPETPAQAPAQAPAQTPQAPAQTPAQAPAQTSQAPAQTPQMPATQAPAAAGGPGGSGGPIIIPKQVTTPPPTEPAPAPPPPPPVQTPQYQIQVQVPEVQIPVNVETVDGQFVPKLTAAQFSLTEDGVRQKITRVDVVGDAPMTCVLLVEFRNEFWPLLYQTLEASYYFTNQLQPHDWVALVSYDLKPTIVVDFTQDRAAIMQGLNSLRFPGFNEGDLFDSLADTMDRLDGVKGHKIIVLISTGLNTFSHTTFDDLRKRIAESKDISIYTIGMGWEVQNYLQTTGHGEIEQLDFLQAENELRYIAQNTGGRYYEPRFEGEYNGIFSEIAASVRNQYILSYTPTNQKLDGTFRKVKVELVGPNGQPLKIVDQKGKNVKYDINYKEGYYARHVVE